MMNNKQLNIFNDSYQRCIADLKFIDRFYEIFLSSSDEIKRKRSMNLRG